MATPEKQAKAPAAARDGTADDAADDVTVIRKYANRRLYNTATSSYVTLDTLCRMVKDGKDFVVYDARTGADITRAVLTQIIVEEEAKGQNLLPIGFLRQLISFYGDSLQTVVPRYLEQTMATFAEHQDATRSHMQEALGALFPLNQFQELSSQNMTMFQNALKMFSPAASGAWPESAPATEAKPGPGADDAPAASGDPLKAVQEQLDALQEQVRALSAGQPDDES